MEQYAGGEERYAYLGSPVTVLLADDDAIIIR